METNTANAARQPWSEHVVPRPHSSTEDQPTCAVRDHRTGAHGGISLDLPFKPESGGFYISKAGRRRRSLTGQEPPVATHNLLSETGQSQFEKYRRSIGFQRQEVINRQAPRMCRQPRFQMYPGNPFDNRSR
jgi:hypothetical protein